MNTQEQFEQANATGDGKLTLEQTTAAVNKPLMRHFHQLDADEKGYLTLAQVKAFAKQMKPADNAERKPKSAK